MIVSSVGKHGLNKQSDVLKVQQLLNKYITAQHIMVLAFLEEDGLCGAVTIACIEDFQADIVGMSNPDGKIDVPGRTLKALQAYSTPVKQKLFELALGINPTMPVLKSKPKVGQTANVAPALAGVDPRKLMTRAAIAKAYGSISKDKKWAKRAEFLKKYTVPSSIKNDKDYNWVNTYDPKKRKVSSIWCHQAMHSFLDKSLLNLKQKGLLGDLKQFGGSHAIRATRGTTNWSAHSWALAIDINMDGNGLGEKPAMSAEFAKCFTDAGFGWGGHYNRKDGMHFTLAGFDMPRQS